MKRFLFLSIGLIVLSVFAGRIFALQNLAISQGKPNTNVVAQIISPTLLPLTPTRAPAALPQSLAIPKLGVTAVVEQVGLDKDKNMDVPKDDMNVGWYQYGVKPGEKGNAVIAGHFDTREGTPAVFYQLEKLLPGDEIVVTDTNGGIYTFVIEEINTYKTNKFPIQKVFGKADQPYLQLITCEGVFDKAIKQYNERLVVRAKLQE